MSRCRYNPDGPRLLPTHLAACNDAACQGCEPCGERHCTALGCPGRHLQHHESQTCAKCVGYVRRNIAGIVALDKHLLTEAIHRGIDSEAAMLEGPVANPEAHGYIHHSATSGRIDAAFIEDQRDELHPAYVLGQWDRMICEHLGHDRLLKVTAATAAAYIGAQLTHLAQDPEFGFDDLGKEVRACLAHLEDVLSDGEREEKGAPCPSCGGPALVKDYGATDDADLWVCPSPTCHQVWTESAYRTMIDGVYIEVAETLTAAQIEAKYRVRPGTLRQWANRGHVRSSKTHDGKTVYDVADTLSMRDAQVLANDNT